MRMAVDVADNKTSFRLDQIEARLKTLGDRTHDIANLAHECKLRLDATDLDTRLRNIEAWVNEQKGKEMQNRLIIGAIAAIVSMIGAGIVEMVVKTI